MPDQEEVQKDKLTKEQQEYLNQINEIKAVLKPIKAIKIREGTDKLDENNSLLKSLIRSAFPALIVMLLSYLPSLVSLEGISLFNKEMKKDSVSTSLQMINKTGAEVKTDSIQASLRGKEIIKPKKTSIKDIEVYALWGYPIIVFGIFIFFAWMANKTIRKEIYKKDNEDSDESEITRIVDKYSGIVDGIGTALPLIGAALILFVVGLGEEGDAIFLGFAVPFEIKSIFILAFAKLFESVFDELALKYQEIMESVRYEERLYWQMRSLPKSSTGSVTLIFTGQPNDIEANFGKVVKTMNEIELKNPEAAKVMTTLTGTFLSGLSNDNVTKNIENIKLILGK